ncbi:hypothetical protein KC352_g47302, partial [Hortaea werneckii]
EATWDLENKSAISIRNADFTWERTPGASTTDKGEAPKGMKQLKQEKKQAKKDAKEDKRKSKIAEKDGSVPGTPQDSTRPQTPASPTAADDEDQKPFQVRNIDLDFGRNELVAVIGSVGSGKSSFLGALAGDMRRTKGQVTFGANRAFCPQYAWIQNASVKQNIIFGKDYDDKWYNDVVDA